MGCFCSRAPDTVVLREKQQKITDIYDIGKVLGNGGRSVVKYGIRKTDKQTFAIKIVTRKNLQLVDELSLREEVRILQSIHHENIINAYEFFEEEKYFYVVLEYVGGGELFDRIVKRSSYSEKDARDLSLILLNAIKYLHERHIVHRDLKPENLLLTSKDDDANIKLADFGFAAVAEGFTIDGMYGTPGFIAPEILDNKLHGKPVDMWSFGVILYILLSGYPPFYDDDVQKSYNKTLRCKYEFHNEYWRSISNEAKDLIKHLLVRKPKKRYTVQQALSHPWLKTKDDILLQHKLDTSLAGLKTFQAKKRWKKGINAVLALNRMRLLSQSNSTKSGEQDDDSGDDETGFSTPKSGNDEDFVRSVEMV